VVYTGIKNLKIGLYNNVSFYSLDAGQTLAYDEDIAAVNGSIYSDESSLVLYNELGASYSLGKIVPSVMIRNYYGTLTARNGVTGQDYGRDILIVEAKAAYKINNHMELRGGVKFENTIYDTPAVSDVLKNSNFVFSIPVGVTLTW
jgi:hypothetical protein